MIVCHAFNALVLPAEHGTSAYKASQLVGGMAAVIFLFVAGMTFALGMKPGRGFAWAFRRGAWVLGFAYLFRIVNWLCDSPRPPWQSVLRVDILNVMGAAMLLLAPLVLLRGRVRLAAALAAGVLLNSGAPFMARVDWAGFPLLAAEYLRPRRGSFSLFPYGAYLAFGLAAGASAMLRRDPGWKRWMTGAAAAGALLTVGGRLASEWTPAFFGPIDFWSDDPSLALIRTGLAVLLLTTAFLLNPAGQTSVCRLSKWTQTLGRESLLVYWAHIAIVYGLPLQPWRGKLGIGAASAVTLTVIAAMVALAQARISLKNRRLNSARSPAAVK
jgi:uncharacterized membrane protein